MTDQSRRARPLGGLTGSRLELNDAPPAVFDLLAWLDSFGLRQTEEHVLDRFNQSALFEDERTRVRIVVDRGDWAMGMGVTAHSSTFHPDVWEAYLDGSEEADDTPLEHQVEFVVTRWGDAVEATAADDDAETKLQAIDRDSIRRLLGRDPGKG